MGRQCAQIKHSRGQAFLRLLLASGTALLLLLFSTSADAALDSWVSGGSSGSSGRSRKKSKINANLVAIASYGTLLINDKINSSSAKLNSGPDFGGAFIWKIPYSKNWILDVYLGVQPRNFRNPSTTKTMTGNNLLLFHGGGQFTGTWERIAFGFGLEAQQLPFVRGTTITNIAIESVLQPSATFTLSLAFWRLKNFSIVGDGQIAYLTSTKWGTYEVQGSTAYGGRVYIESSSARFRFGASLSKKSQKTTITSQDYDVPGLFLGVGF